MDNSIGIGDIAALATVTGVVIYVLGLVGLTIPIRRIFVDELTTAWYAVSLVPKTVVAGQGIRIWLQWPIVIIGAVLGAAALAPLLAYLASESFHGPDNSAIVSGGITNLLFIVSIVAFLTARNRHRIIAMGLPHSRLSDRSSLAGTARATLIAWVALLVGSALLMWVLVYTLELIYGNLVIGSPTFLTYGIVFFSGSFLISVPIAITAAPPYLRC
jgi:hypothetical protein